jgi:hypothetical protein
MTHHPIRPGLHQLAPRRRRPVLRDDLWDDDRRRRLVVALLTVILIMLAGIGLSLARAQSLEEDTLALAQAAAAVAPGATPTEAPEPTRFVPASRSGIRPAVARWEPLLAEYPWDVETALRVIECESKGNPAVWNAQGSGAHGLFQTMPEWGALAYVLTGSTDLGEPAVNVAVAYYLWADSGGTFRWHWSSSRGCWG